MPNQDLTLYAKWENDTYDSCFTVYRGEIQGYRYPLDAICGSDVIIPESIY